MSAAITRTFNPALHRAKRSGQRFPLVRAGLIAHWRLREGTGTSVVDTVAGYTGTFGATTRAPAWATGPIVDFGDGSTGKHVALHSAGFASAFNGAEGTAVVVAAVSAAGVWTDTVNRRLLSLRVDGSNWVMIDRSPTNNTVLYQYNAGGTSKSINKGSVSPTGYMRLALTWSDAADQLIAYYNGVAVAAATTALGTWAGSPAASLTVLGAASNAVASGWAGSAAGVLVYNRPLSAGEIAKLDQYLVRDIANRGLAAA